MLFVAKYGRRNSQNQLGAGLNTVSRKLGITRAYGMRDTVIPDGTTVTDIYFNAAIALTSDGGNTSYEYPGSPNFLGIEDIHGSISELLDRAYYANETPADCGKVRITMPDLSTRRVCSISPAHNFPRSVVHGKYCDIVSCSSSNGSTTTCYPDWQTVNYELRNTWAPTKAIKWSSMNPQIYSGVFCLDGGNSVGTSITSAGSRLIFRGNIVETTDIDMFLNAREWRG